MTKQKQQYISMDVVVTGNKIEFIGVDLYLVDTIKNSEQVARFNSVMFNQEELSKFDAHCMLIDIKSAENGDNKVKFVFVYKFNKEHAVLFPCSYYTGDKETTVFNIKHNNEVNFTPNKVVSDVCKKIDKKEVRNFLKGIWIHGDKQFYTNGHIIVFNDFKFPTLEHNTMYHLVFHELLQCFDKGVFIKSFLHSSDEVIHNIGVEYSNGCRYIMQSVDTNILQRMLDAYKTHLEGIRISKPYFTLSYTDYMTLLEQIKYYNKNRKDVTSKKKYPTPIVVDVNANDTKIYIAHNISNRKNGESYGEFLARCPEDFNELLTVNTESYDKEYSQTLAIDSAYFERSALFINKDTVEFNISQKMLVIKQMKYNMNMSIMPLLYYPIMRIIMILNSLNKFLCLSELLSITCLLYTSPSPRDKRQSRMPSSA